MTPATLSSAGPLPVLAAAAALGVALYVALAGLALWAAVRWAREALEVPTDPPSRA